MSYNISVKLLTVAMLSQGILICMDTEAAAAVGEFPDIIKQLPGSRLSSVSMTPHVSPRPASGSSDTSVSASGAGSDDEGSSSDSSTGTSATAGAAALSALRTPPTLRKSRYSSSTGDLPLLLSERDAPTSPVGLHVQAYNEDSKRNRIERTINNSSQELVAYCRVTAGYFFSPEYLRAVSSFEQEIMRLPLFPEEMEEKNYLLVSTKAEITRKKEIINKHKLTLSGLGKETKTRAINRYVRWLFDHPGEKVLIPLSITSPVKEKLKQLKSAQAKTNYLYYTGD